MTPDVDPGVISRYDISMGDLLIRNVPRRTLDALKARAQRRGRSVQAEALELLEQAEQPAGAALVEWLKANRTPGVDVQAALRALREDRDSR